MPFAAHGTRRAVSSGLVRTDHAWVTDELLADAFHRFACGRAPRNRRALGHVPGPLEFQRRAAIDRRRNSVSLGGHDLVQPLQDLEVATYQWLKRLWDPQNNLKITWHAPRSPQTVLPDDLPSRAITFPADEEKPSNKNIYDTAAEPSPYPTNVSLDEYKAHLSRVHSLGDLRRLHWELGASFTDASNCTAAALARLLQINSPKEDAIAFLADPLLNAYSAPRAIELTKHYGFFNLTVADRVALLSPWLEVGSMEKLKRAALKLTYSHRELALDFERPWEKIARMLHDAEAMFQALRNRFPSTSALDRLSELEAHCYDYILIRLRKTFLGFEDVAEGIFLYLEKAANPRQFVNALAKSQKLLGFCLNALATRCENASLRWASILPRLPHSSVAFLLGRYLETSLEESAADDAASLRHAEVALRVLLTVEPKDSFLPCYSPVYSLLADHFAPGQLAIALDAHPKEKVKRAIFKFWIQDKLFRVSDESTLMDNWAQPHSERFPVNSSSTLRPEASLYGPYLPENGRYLESAPEMQPVLQAMLVETRFLQRTWPLFKSCKAAADRILRSLLDSKRFVAFAWYAYTMRKFWDVWPEPRTVSHFIHAASPTHPREALSTFFLCPQLPLADVSDLLFNAFSATEAVMHPRKSLTVLERLSDQMDRGGDESREHMADMLHQLALHVATKAKLNCKRAHEAVCNILAFLEHHRVPIDTRLSQAFVFTAVANWYRDAKPIVRTQAASTLSVVSAIDGAAVADKLDQAIWQARGQYEALLETYAHVLDRHGIAVHFDRGAYDSEMAPAETPFAGTPLAEPSVQLYR